MSSAARVLRVGPAMVAAVLVTRRYIAGTPVVLAVLHRYHLLEDPRQAFPAPFLGNLPGDVNHGFSPV